MKIIGEFVKLYEMLLSQSVTVSALSRSLQSYSMEHVSQSAVALNGTCLAVCSRPQWTMSRSLQSYSMEHVSQSTVVLNGTCLAV